MQNCERVIWQTGAKRAVIGRPKLAYLTDYHARHERVNCVICKTRNAKWEHFYILLLRHLCIGLYF